MRALRAAGLSLLAGVRDAGDIAARLDTADRDPTTGVIAIEDLRAANAELRVHVEQLLSRGEIPLVVGGDDSYLPGTLAGARTSHPDLALVFIDGHLDACDGTQSPTGEGADMNLAVLTGRGPRILVDAPAPIVRPENVYALGSRLEEPWCRLADGSLGREADIVDPNVHVRRADQIMEAGASPTAEELLDKLAGRPFWLHLDIDVLDEAAMAAVSYPQPDGLSWDALHELTLPLSSSPNVVGLDLACFNPDLDPDGAFAARTVELLASLVGALRAGRPRGAD